MADIHVERKRPKIWPWIIGLVVLAVLIWAVMEFMGRGKTTTANPPAGSILPAAPAGLYRS